MKANRSDHVPTASTALPLLPEGWQWTDFENIGKAIDPQPSHRTPPEMDGGVAYIGMGDVGSDGKINFEGARKVSPGVLEEQRGRYQLERGDFFIGKIGTLGNPVALNPPFDYALSANVVLIQIRTALVDRSFTFYYMSSPTIERLLRTGSRATTQAAFGIQKMRTLPFPLCPAREQRRITEELDRRLSIVAELQSQLDLSLVKAQRLRQTVLKRAFDGKLIAQDPTDEPASVILERIRANRNVSQKCAPTAPRGRKKKEAANVS
jgi:type I restriction enzyme S subunit